MIKLLRESQRSLLATLIVISSLILSTPLPLVSATACPTPITTNTTLSTDCTGSIVIGADMITLNCAGHTITGSGSDNGISLVSRVGVSIKNCHVTNFNVGFFLDHSPSSKLSGNTATGNSGSGFEIDHSPFNQLKGNTAGNNDDGFDLSFSFNIELNGNTATGNSGEGFRLNGVSGGKLTGNIATGNRAGFRIQADFPIDNMLKNNKADDNRNYGYQDLTFGKGTFGTGNTYVTNECSGNTIGGSSPTRLCTPQS